MLQALKRHPIEISQYLKFDFYYNNETYHKELGLNITSSPDLPKQKIAMHSISQKPYSAYAQLCNVTKMSLWNVFLHKGWFPDMRSIPEPYWKPVDISPSKQLLRLFQVLLRHSFFRRAPFISTIFQIFWSMNKLNCKQKRVIVKSEIPPLPIERSSA